MERLHATCQCRRLRDLIEGTVNLNAVEKRGIITEPAFILEFRRVSRFIGYRQYQAAGAGIKLRLGHFPPAGRSADT
jgi:hypothetical protein